MQLVLFGSWLSETRSLQISHYGRNYEALAADSELLGNTVNQQMAEVVWELGEAMNEYPGHKTWVTDRTVFNRDEFLGEIVDALHFLANVLTALGYTDEELNTAYLAKMQKNRDRMASGTYDGVSDKCPQCHREMVVGDSLVLRCFEHGYVQPEAK